MGVFTVRMGSNLTDKHLVGEKSHHSSFITVYLFEELSLFILRRRVVMTTRRFFPYETFLSVLTTKSCMLKLPRQPSPNVCISGVMPDRTRRVSFLGSC
jgi:hypothetical protein